MRAKPAGVAGLDGVGVGGFRRYGGVGVREVGVAGVIHQYGQIGGVGAAQDLVARDAVVVGVVPEQHDAVVAASGEQACGFGGRAWLLCRLFRWRGRWLGRHGDFNAGRPWAALLYVAVPVVVAGPHPHAVFSPLFQADHRVRGGGGEGVAPIDSVVVLVRGPLAAGLLPGHAVVVGGVAGRVPADGDLTGVWATHADVADRLVAHLGLCRPVQQERHSRDQQQHD